MKKLIVFIFILSIISLSFIPIQKLSNNSFEEINNLPIWAGKLKLPGTVRIAVHGSDNEELSHLAWPKALIAPDGTIVLAYLAGSFHGSHGKNSPAISLSNDNGKTFSSPQILKDFSLEEEYTASGNLAMGIAHDGAIILLAMGYRGNEANHIFGWRSEDNGKTWSEVDTSNLGPNKTGSVCGTIIQLPGKRLMAMGHYRKPSIPYEIGIWQSISFDNGQTWEVPQMVTNINGGEPVLVRADDRLLVFIRGRGPASTRQYIAVSDNFGQTWHTELSDIIAQNNHTQSFAHPFAMVNPKNKEELIALTVERPVPGSIWLWRGNPKDLNFALDRQLMEIPKIDNEKKIDYGYTWLLNIEKNHYLMFYYHGLNRNNSSIWVAEFYL
ncbi:BNR repeat-like domain-containing protein [Tangfeifania diversioriginum]|uniref:exo-alpha-sialidase n=1 Tax=Tangfeifania diversioriginum TaxID=1168035 RepID=A0A1M6PNB1_9BACT|nr:sialidase family protein [Tangfeifania diversioriginum]SHK09445.1 BNR repeat-like domain-containing protein [Tangfeifania diversioriginum]